MSCRGAGADFCPVAGGLTGRPQKSTAGASAWPSTRAEAQLNRLASPWQMGGIPLCSFDWLGCGALWACAKGDNIKRGTMMTALATRLFIWGASALRLDYGR